MTTLDETEWWQRVHAAEVALDDTSQLVKLQASVDRMMASADPTVDLITGESLLRAATRVGILSGSFNPLTRAHLALAEAARQAAGLEAIVWVCAAITVDKERVDRAALADRLAQLAPFSLSKPNNAVALTNRGLYVDQALLLRPLARPDGDVAIIIGFDKVVQIFDPRYYADREAALRALFGSARLLVAPRDDHGEESLRGLLSLPENQPYAPRVRYLDVPTTYAEDSSTEARRLAAEVAADPLASERLPKLLAPEGYALAATGAYTGAESGDQDVYRWRSSWVQLIARHEPQPAAALPALHLLVESALRQDAVGDAVRETLHENSAGGQAATLRHAFDLVRLAATGR